MSPRAIFWDFGGVITTSPFDAFRDYERRNRLPRDFIRTVNSRNRESNAWAQLERSDIDVGTFCRLFVAESAALGHRVPGEDVLALLAGEVREEMVAALTKLKPTHKQACLTNNARTGTGPGMAADPRRAARVAQVMALFDVIVESSRVGVRKPEPRFYQIACDTMEVEPAEVVFLDDLGINLKPARAMGMRTIKVGDPDQALGELEQALGVTLR